MDLRKTENKTAHLGLHTKKGAWLIETRHDPADTDNATLVNHGSLSLTIRLAR